MRKIIRTVAAALYVLVSGCAASEPPVGAGDAEAAAHATAAFNAGRYAEARQIAEPIAERAPAAALVLGRVYYTGSGAIQDYVMARKYFDIAARSGSHQAMGYLGIIYQFGRGVAVDLDKAIEYYKSSSDRGDDAAKYNLANLLFRGTGAYQNKTSAIALYQQAVDNGNVYAMVELGRLYENGNFLTSDTQKAVQLYKRAAERDFYAAHAALASLYAKGIGAPPNVVYAAMHLMVATRPDRTLSPAERSAFAYDSVVVRRDKLLQVLTDDQRARARALANLWPDVPSAAPEPLDLKTAR